MGLPLHHRYSLCNVIVSLLTLILTFVLLSPGLSTLKCYMVWKGKRGYAKTFEKNRFVLFSLPQTTFMPRYQRALTENPALTSQDEQFIISTF